MPQPSKSQAKKAPAKRKATPAQRGKPGTKKETSRQKQTAAHGITPEQRQQMIAEAAYFIAKRQGFTAHALLDDWLAAEAEIDTQLSQQVR